MKDFKELAVWRKAHVLTLGIYQMTRDFPREELYGLTSQLRRSALSIGANIAEGCGRRADGELCRFLNIAYGSASELEYHLLLSHDLSMIGDANFRAVQLQVDEVQRMLTSLIRQVRPPAKASSAPVIPANTVGGRS